MTFRLHILKKHSIGNEESRIEKKISLEKLLHKHPTYLHTRLPGRFIGLGFSCILAPFRKKKETNTSLHVFLSSKQTQNLTEIPPYASSAQCSVIVTARDISSLQDMPLAEEKCPRRLTGESLNDTENQKRYRRS